MQVCKMPQKSDFFNIDFVSERRKLNQTVKIGWNKMTIH